MDELEQRVARMIADMRQKELDVNFGGFDGYTDEGKQTALAEVRAIIPMVLEEAAKRHDLIRQLVALKAAFGAAGMFRTMHALEPATQAAGYELEAILQAKEPTDE